MQYKKFLVVASKLDKAGINITTNLSQFQSPQQGLIKNFDFYLVDKEIIYTENLDLKKINQYDFVIFASKHKSSPNAGGTKTLSVHAPGNFRTAEFGGEKEKLCKSSALFMKQAFEKINENMKRYNLKDYELTLEATHHGPLIEVPCVFIEIGPTDFEWSDRRVGFIVAKAISETIRDFHEDETIEIAIAIGGPHYCPNFNKIQLKSNIAISHIIPQYALPITEEMIHEAIKKTDEEVELAILDWKGIGRADERQRVLEAIDKFHLNKRMTSDISKEFSL